MSLILIFSFIFCFVLVINFWKTIRFQWKFMYYLMVNYLLIILLSPATLRKPGDVDNLGMLSVCSTFFLKIIGVTYELRGIDHFTAEGGHVMVGNHQQMIDNAGVMANSSVVKRFTLTMKRSMLYHPGGVFSVLYGIVFVNRAGGSKSFKTVNSWAFAAKNKKIKFLMFPEGTRNFEAFKSQCLLPFKKGCFHAAIAAQIPILPFVTSPYYFINHDRKIFGRGRVILEALPAIPTVGLTSHDVDALILKTRNLMTIKYRQLTEEVLSTLPITHPVFEWIDDVE